MNEKNLKNLTPEELGKLFPIQIVPYNPNWVEIFKSENALIQNTLGNDIALKIEHFGSTAVIGLAAKPTIDILVEIPTLTESLKEMIISKMTAIDYLFIWRTDEEIPYIHFVKGYTPAGYDENVFHIHMGDKEHPLWDRIYFRDYLIDNPMVAKEYEQLKISLAQTYPFDREGYTNAKFEFVKKITKKAKKEKRELLKKS